MRDRVPDYGIGNVQNGDGRYLVRWALGLFAGLILVAVTAGLTWAVSESGRVSALEAGQAAINVKLDHIIHLVERKRGP